MRNLFLTQSTVSGGGIVKRLGTVFALAAANSFVAEAAAELPMTVSTIDHVILATPDVEAVSDQLFSALGVRPTFGGVHSDGGSQNSLLSLGDVTYLEVLGPGPVVVESSRDQAAARALKWPDIAMLSAGNTDLATVSEIASELGLPTTPLPGSRKKPDGTMLEWDMMMVRSEKYKGLVPFFIDWKDAPHPSTTSAQGALMTDIFVTHPEPDELAKIYDAFGLSIPVLFGNAPGIFVTIKAGDKTIMLSGSGNALED